MRRLFAFLGLIVCSAAAIHADQVVLKNGDRLTGSIVKKDGKTLTLNSPVLGILNMPWDQVESLKTDEPLNLVLASGQTLKATVDATQGQARLQETSQSVPVADINAIRNAVEQASYERLQHPGWLQLWSGTATIGFAGTAGNARTQTFTTNASADRTTRTDKTTVYFNAVRASALTDHVDQPTAQAVRGGVGYNHNISTRFFVNSTADFEYDLFQNLDLRYVLGGGLGFSVWRTDRKSLSVVAGAAFDHASFSAGSSPAFTRSSGEGYWGDDFALKLTPASSLVQSFRMYNNFSDSHDFRTNFDIANTTKIAKWLTWNLGVSVKYLNDPSPGRKTNDVLYTTGLGIVFHR